MFESTKKVKRILGCMNHDFLKKNRCYLSGSAPILLAYQDYREIENIEFSCSSEGMIAIRDLISENRSKELFDSSVVVSLVSSNTAGVQFLLNLNGHMVPLLMNQSLGCELFESDPESSLSVPTLSRSGLFFEKLLANSDRWNDKNHSSKDMIDLASMIHVWGQIPEESWRRAEEVYGQSVAVAYSKAQSIFGIRGYLMRCLYELNMHPANEEKILSVVVSSGFQNKKVKPSF